MDDVHTARRHFGSKWGSYIQWRAFSAFWISVWTCALSPLTLCSLRGKRHDQRKVVDIERKEGRKAGRGVKKNRKNEGKISEKKATKEREGTQHTLARWRAESKEEERKERKQWYKLMNWKHWKTERVGVRKKKGDWTDEQRCVTLKSADLTVRDTFIKAVMIQLDGRLDMFSTTNRFNIRLD